MIFKWLTRAAACGDPAVERAARVLQDYYQGVSPADRAAIEARRAPAVDRERLEFEARQSRRKHFPETED